MNGRYLLSIAALVLLTALALPAAASEARRIPYPLVFLPGLGDKPRPWQHLQAPLESAGLRFGGNINSEGLYRYPRPPDYNPHGDFFFLTLDDHYAPLREQARALRRALARLYRDSDAPGFVVIGFSLGGLVARTYLTLYPRRHYVRKLVTIGSPHQGSHWAYLHDLFAPIKRECTPDETLADLLRLPMCAAIAALENSYRLRLDAPALADLKPPQWDEAGKPLNLLAELAAASHPSDVAYVAVVGDVELPESVAQLERELRELEQELDQGELGLTTAKARLIALLRHLTGLLTRNPFWLGGGDGGVSATSQDLSRLPWFTRRINGVSDTGDAPVRTLWYRIHGADDPLRVEYVREHHLAQTRDFANVRRALAAPVRLEFEAGERRTYFDHVDLHGRLEDYLLRPEALTLERLSPAAAEVPAPPAAVFSDDGVGFVFKRVALAPGANRFRLTYTVERGFGDRDDTTRTFVVHYRPNRLVGIAVHPLTLLVVLAALAALVLWLAYRRRGPKADNPS